MNHYIYLKKTNQNKLGYFSSRFSLEYYKISNRNDFQYFLVLR